MTSETFDLFASTLQEIASSRQLTNDHDGRTKALLTRLSEKGATLRQCSEPKMMDRPITLLRSYCTKFGIRFPDFTPPNMCTYLMFAHRGDYLTLSGELAEPVAKALDIVVTTRDGVQSCSVPIHAWDDAKTSLRVAGYVAKKGKKPKLVKSGKVAEHA